MGINKISGIFKDLTDGRLVLCFGCVTASEIGHELAHILSYSITSLFRQIFH